MTNVSNSVFCGWLLATKNIGNKLEKQDYNKIFKTTLTEILKETIIFRITPNYLNN